MAFDRAGVWALLSRALAGDAIARASIDLDGFDFAGIEDPFDAMMLPGAVKYGGIGGLFPLCTAGQTELSRAPAAAVESEAGRRRPSGLTVRDGTPEPDRMVRWVMGDRNSTEGLAARTPYAAVGGAQATPPRSAASGGHRGVRRSAPAAARGAPNRPSSLTVGATGRTVRTACLYTPNRGPGGPMTGFVRS